ncbi:MAG: translesion DNA synthesis-associated protein ImuA [Pigmentiphaga sp.]|uniref:translesion DNA synthesis-associated protein ImuA n=1 Tax=Pigmentiphaga sp. TaxID=1977564 RepID=UPI0029B82AB1|nr:translesion DNA synthesis-associated protein ImuA [Pigmentiphaga sp.]MDX3905249.1 translesion DNA synthesis-associated protein ImuA [Pigmentiphaga sp.]
MPAQETLSSSAPAPIHPLLWRGSQLAHASRPCLDTGYPELSRSLPGGGWPLGSLTELLLPQPGIGEVRLLLPALRQVPAGRSIVLLHPPHVPCAQAWMAYRIPIGQLLWIAPGREGDALWAAEQILKHGSCGALLCWSSHPHAAALRRLHLAAQSGDTAFFMFRPIQAARASSPAPLRLQLEAAGGHLRIEVLKRRGPRPDAPLLLPLAAFSPAGKTGRVPLSSEPRHAFVDRHLSDPAQPRRPEPALAG